MISYIKSFFNYLFSYNSIDQYDKEMEIYLAEELFKMDLETKEDEETKDAPDIGDSICVQRTGVITHISEEGDCVLIDGILYCNTTACSFQLSLNDKVTYLGYKDMDNSIVVVRILEVHGEHWGDFEFEADESSYKTIEHVIVGEVDSRQERFVIIKESDLKFSLDNVTAIFVPVQGDFLEMKCIVQFDQDNPMDISSNRVLEVISFRPLRSKIVPAVITQWNGQYGICNTEYFFDKSCTIIGGVPQVGVKTLIESIESNQGSYSWRVMKMVITGVVKAIQNNIPLKDKTHTEESRLEIDKRHNIEVTFPLKFENVRFHEKPQIILNITNKGDQNVTINKWMVLGKRRDSQVNICPIINMPKKLSPNHTYSLTITCCPKFYGYSKEHMIITFRGFKVERFIEINILGDNISTTCVNNYYKRPDDMAMLMNIKDSRTDAVVPGVKTIKSPNFVAVKLGVYNIPEKVWTAITNFSSEKNYLQSHQRLNRFESYFPCLKQNFNITNYMDRWHTLLYIEEVQVTLNIKTYNMKSVFLIRCQEYLGVEVKRLSERRPSLIINDKVVVKDIWDDKAPSYEGFVHEIRGNLILFKFHPRFHESYQGSDVSVEFHQNRTQFRKSHHAINQAIAKLGPDVLFPSRIVTREPQIPLEKLQNIKWFHKNLNSNQKAAVSNVLLGECRPMPYCIYGPPGTGKTVTVIEALLQILTLLPDSRVLVATPSNSAANLITERLLEYRKQFSNSIIRLIANCMIDSENIPDVIKPYCATLNFAREDTVRSTHMVQGGINMNVPASYVARYQVTIGTCSYLGTLAMMELPKGHFTHIIIDEAGQATEPEIMIPMTFVNKESGQIIVAGDPMQLGPTVFSMLAQEYGMNQSYLSRILETFPYQKDYASFKTGFNSKLVTLLTNNYRSLQEVITPSNELFYDSTLVALIDRNTPYIQKVVNVVNQLYESSDEPKYGGIFVHGVKGNNMRASDSPSWYNPEEASMIALTVCKLYKKNITPDELGIITPYVAQIRHLRRLFEHMNLPRPKIGSVEEFQGQERPLIIISTVRSTEAIVPVDQKNFLGFLGNPKRFNVALTRAQGAVLLFCDPHLLVTDILWNKVINQAINENRYMGCEFSLASSKTVEE